MSEGELRMTGARIGGSLDMIGGRIEAPRGPALDLADAIIGGLILSTALSLYVVPAFYVLTDRAKRRFSKAET